MNGKLEDIKNKIYKKAIEIVKNGENPESLWDYARQFTREVSLSELKAIAEILVNNFFYTLSDEFNCSGEYEHETVERWKKIIKGISGWEMNDEIANHLAFMETTENVKIDKDLYWWHFYNGHYPHIVYELPEDLKQKELEEKKVIYSKYISKTIEILKKNNIETDEDPIYFLAGIKKVEDPAIQAEIDFLNYSYITELADVENRYKEEARKKIAKEVSKETRKEALIEEIENKVIPYLKETYKEDLGDYLVYLAREMEEERLIDECVELVDPAVSELYGDNTENFYRDFEEIIFDLTDETLSKKRNHKKSSRR